MTTVKTDDQIMIALLAALQTAHDVCCHPNSRDFICHTTTNLEEFYYDKNFNVPVRIIKNVRSALDECKHEIIKATVSQQEDYKDAINMVQKLDLLYCEYVEFVRINVTVSEIRKVVESTCLNFLLGVDCRGNRISFKDKQPRTQINLSSKVRSLTELVDRGEKILTQSVAYALKTIPKSRLLKLNADEDTLLDILDTTESKYGSTYNDYIIGESSDALHNILPMMESVNTKDAFFEDEIQALTVNTIVKYVMKMSK
jgi:hypothetical protein